MTQYIIDIGAYPDDGQGSPLRTAFDYTNENFNQIFAAGPVLSNIQIGNNTITTTVLNSNLILSPSGIGRIQLNNTLFPRLDNVYDIGTPSLRFNSIYLGTGGINTTGGITTTGNITANYFIGNGSQLTGIVVSAGNSILNGNSNVVVTANGNITVSSAGVSNVVTFANTGAYVIGQVSATGNVSGNFFIGNGSQLTGINVTSSSIQNGTSNVEVYANSDIAFSSNGVSNVMVVSSQDVTITGNLAVTGNATLTGNILGDRLQNGNTSIDIQTANGNANISIGGVANVAVFTPSGLDVAGNLTAGFFSGNGTGLTGILADRGGDTNNWNTLTQMGVYLVNRTSWSGTSGTPLDSQVFVGLLQVQTSQAQTTTQVFYPGQVNMSDIKIQWNRTLWNGSWTPWVKMTNDGQQISGGEF